ncbi:MAG: hypothetical protein ACU843_15160 [Gammaproteobacteria bacterium]
MKKFMDLGMFDDGDTMVTIPSDSPMYEIGEFDRVDTVSRTEPFSVNIVTGLATSLRFKPESIDRVTWLDSNDALVVGDIPTINKDGSLTWVGSTPPQNTTYSVTGRRFPAYFCYMDLPLDRPYHFGKQLPRRVVLRRFDLFGR